MSQMPSRGDISTYLIQYIDYATISTIISIYHHPASPRRRRSHPIEASSHLSWPQRPAPARCPQQTHHPFRFPILLSTYQHQHQPRPLVTAPPHLSNGATDAKAWEIIERTREKVLPYSFTVGNAISQPFWPAKLCPDAAISHPWQRKFFYPLVSMAYISSSSSCLFFCGVRCARSLDVYAGARYAAACVLRVVLMAT